MPDAAAPTRDDGVDARLIPPGIADARARAFVATLARALDDVPLSRFDLTRFQGVDARLLPALVRGHSLQEFMFEGIPEATVRRFLANAAALHARKGTNAGVRFGLSLVGMRVRWVPWHAQVPPGAPNTYKATVYVNEQIFAGQTSLFSERNQRAALAVIDATKRWSQSGSFEIGVGFTGRLGAANRASGMTIDQRPVAAAPDLSRRNALAIAGRAAALTLDRRQHDAAPDLTRRSALAVAGRAAAMQVQRFTFEARP